MSLVFRYELNDPANLTTDASGNGHTLVNEGGVVSFNDPVYGNVAQFDRSSTSRLTLTNRPTSLHLNSDRTFSTWMKNDTTLNHMIFSNGVSDTSTSGSRIQNFASSSTGNIQVVFPNFYNSKMSVMNLGAWYHLCVTFDGQTARTYVDGVDIGSASGSTTSDGGGVMMIGGHPYWPQFAFIGCLSDVRWYSNVMSITEVQGLYHDGPNPVSNEVEWVLDTNSKYEISSKSHLIQLMNNGTIYPNTGSFPTDWKSSAYVQTADVDLLGDIAKIVPIGDPDFTGEYDGNGYKISNWCYTGGDTHVGLFGTIMNGTVKNVRITGVCKMTGFTNIGGMLAGFVSGTSNISNIEVDLLPGSHITQSDLPAGINNYIGTVIGMISSSVAVTCLTFKGYIDSINHSSNAAGANVGGVVGFIYNSIGTNTLFRNIGTFTTPLTGTNVGGVVGAVENSVLTKTLNAMTGNITETTDGSYIGGVVGRLIQDDASQTCNEFVNSMKGGITATTTNSHAGGVVGNMTQLIGTTIHSFMNYMLGDIVNTFNRDGVGGLVALADANLNLTTSINAMNGTVNNTIVGSPTDSATVATVDASFGLVFTTDHSSTTSPVTGLLLDPGSGLPVVDLSATGSDSVVHTFEFVFANLPRVFYQIQINVTGDDLQLAELKILDLDGTNISLLGTATVTMGSSVGPATNANDGNTDTIGIALQDEGVANLTIDLDRGYILSEINKVVFYNGVSDAMGGVVTLHSSDGDYPEQLGVLTAELIQEFVIVPLPGFLIPTSGVARINVTVVEAPGALSYKITVQESGSEKSRTAHIGISEGEHAITYLVPETDYIVKLFADNGDGSYELVDTETVQTLANSSSNYIRDDYGHNGRYDVRGFDPSELTLLSEVINDVFTTGDIVDIRLGTIERKVAFVKRGETVSTDNSIMVQFDPSSGDGQEFTMQLSDSSTLQVGYDETNNYLNIGGQNVKPGESIVIEGKKMTVKEL